MISEGTLTAKRELPEKLIIDFDYKVDPGGRDSPYDAIEELMRDDPAELSYTKANGGHWIATSYEMIHQIYRDYQNFTTFPVTIPPIKDKPRKLVPIEIDPPDHKKYRAILGPLFTPRATSLQEPKIRAIAVELIEGLRTKGECEFLTELAEQFPPLVFLKLMGMPTDQVSDFVSWAKGMLSNDPDTQADCGAKIGVFIAQFITSKESDLADDWASALFTTKDEENGDALDQEERMDIAFFLFLAGLDTVVNAMTNMWRYLATKPELIDRLRSNPAKIPDAIEEMFRVFAVVNSSRMAKNDVELGEVTIKTGEQVLLMTAISNRDPAEFDNPLSLDINRERNVHLSFGAGAHRCIGSNLARLEVKIFLEEWIARIPKFGIRPDVPICSRAGITMGYESLPLIWET